MYTPTADNTQLTSVLGREKGSNPLAGVSYKIPPSLRLPPLSKLLQADAIIFTTIHFGHGVVDFVVVWLQPLLVLPSSIRLSTQSAASTVVRAIQHMILQREAVGSPP